VERERSAAQSIVISLPGAPTVERIRLLVAQDPHGRSRSEIAVRRGRGGWRTIAVIDELTRDGQWLTVKPDRPLRGVRAVRVMTTAIEGDLWPAWREISIVGR
jgi:hypothetical protein